MRDFEDIQIDYKVLEKELLEFENLLKEKSSLGEQEILDFFKDRSQLIASIGWFYPDLSLPNKISREYSIGGDFECDFIIGDSESKFYCFVEFENAEENSIFKKQGRSQLYWSSRFLNGFSQVVDWFWMLDDIAQTEKFKYTFGGSKNEIGYEGLLIIGRDKFIDLDKQRRINWWQNNIIVNSKHIKCLTFDRLAQIIRKRVDTFITN
ncbi:MAG: DUF4263 domain-containing protein [Candidatus Caenarcaniphilales bacterium]|nr:DUF4263 domain-containing protein [Candidatus Caenarcaniphilales bacterium]